MGLEVVPIVTCASCGLGFDPKPRTPAPPVALVEVEPPRLVHAEVADTDTMLVVRESVFSGLLMAVLGAALAYASFLAVGVAAWIFVPFVAAASVLALYGGIGRMVNHTVVYVSADSLMAWQRPLPRHRQRFVAGEVWSLAVTRRATDGAGVTWDVVATEGSGARRTVRLVNVSHEAIAHELVHAIREHRTRLGAPILEPTEEA